MPPSFRAIDCTGRVSIRPSILDEIPVARWCGAPNMFLMTMYLGHVTGSTIDSGFQRGSLSHDASQDQLQGLHEAFEGSMLD